MIKQIVVLLILSASVYAATEPHKSVEAQIRNKIVLADVDNVNVDTTIHTRPMSMLFPFVRYDRQIRLSELDTAWVNDTIKFHLRFGPTKKGPFVVFDSVIVAIPAVTADTVVNIAVEIDMDSTDATRNGRWLQLLTVNTFTMADAAADTNLIGEAFPFHWEYWMTPMYQQEADSLQLLD